MKEFINKLIGRLEEKQADIWGNESLHHFYSEGFGNGIDYAIDKINQLAEEYNNGWIPCSERLPEEGVDVLVWFEYYRYGSYNRLYQTTGISFTYNGEWSGFVNGSSGWSQLSIIAWQPLPAPYKE